MRLKWLGVPVLMLALLLLSFGAFAEGGEGKRRVIAHSDREVSDAVSRGCSEVRHARTLTALECPESEADSLGLQEDVRVFAVDSAANRQIGADVVQSSENRGAGTSVVVLDTGYNYKHPELKSSYRGGWNFVKGNNNPYDDNGHGSHVAGIITADGSDPRAKGVAPDAGIIAGKVLDASGSGYLSDIVAAIYWAVNGPDGVYGTSDDFNASAISLSLGTARTYAGFCDDAYPDFRNAINYAVGHGVMVVVAAGNSASGVSSPGCVSNSTTVGAVDGYDRIASFSGRGSAVDLVAPGVNVYSAWRGTRYATASGTSMATPMVSGAVALIKSAHPAYTVDQVKAALFGTAMDLGTPGWDSVFGWGRVNATAAVAYVG